MKRLITILLLCCSFALAGQKLPGEYRSNKMHYRLTLHSDSTFKFNDSHSHGQGRWETSEDTLYLQYSYDWTDILAARVIAGKRDTVLIRNKKLILDNVILKKWKK